jgi:hypothetical protein
MQLGMQGFAESKLRRVGTIESEKRGLLTAGRAITETSLLQPKG